MSDEVKDVVAEMEKKHKRFLSSYQTGMFLKHCTVLGLIPAVPIVVVIILWLVLGMDLKVAVLLYFLLLLSVYIIGAIKTKINLPKLRKLQGECYKLQTQYLKQKCKECRIENHESLFKPVIENVLDENESPKYYDYTYIRFKNGISVSNGGFSVPVKYKGEKIEIYRLKDHKMKERYDDEVNKLDSSKVSINRFVSSVKFNEKFGVLVPRNEERVCLKFLSPHLQLNMYSRAIFDNLKDITIVRGSFSAKTMEKIQLPTIVAAFEHKSFVDCFNEIDTYCKARKELADYINEEMQFIM